MNRLAALFACIAAGSCASAPPPNAKPVGPDGEVTLAPGERVLLEKKMLVRFVNVVEDSRCPSDVACIWAGEVKILLDGSKEDLHPTYLGEGKSILIGKHEVTLVRVDPQPVSKSKIAREDYRATLRVAH